MRPTALFRTSACPVRALVFALGLSGSCVVHAGPLDDTFDASLGAFILSTHTTVRADGSPAPGAPVEIGTPIDVERQLGISDRTSLRFDGYWRFFERHKIRVMYFDESRSGQKSITDEIVFRGQTYPVNSQLSARCDTRVAMGGIARPASVCELCAGHSFDLCIHGQLLHQGHTLIPRSGSLDLNVRTAATTVALDL